METKSSCYHARLKNYPENLIDDCDLVKDNLHLALNKITTRPDCISQIRLELPESTDPDGYPIYYDYETGGRSVVDVENPLVDKNRCVITKGIVTFMLPNSQSGFEHLEYILNPLARKCLQTTEFTSKTDHMTVDIAEAIPEKLWEMCIFSVSDGTKRFEIQEPIPRKSILVNFTTDVCGDKKNTIGDGGSTAL